MGRRMTLKGQISLCLAAFFLALAGQIFLSFYQSGTVLRELDDQMGNFNAISRFQGGVERLYFRAGELPLGEQRAGGDH